MSKETKNGLKAVAIGWGGLLLIAVLIWLSTMVPGLGWALFIGFSVLGVSACFYLAGADLGEDY